MKVIKIIYDKNTSYINDIVDSVEHNVVIEKFNLDNHKQAREARSIMVRFGTTNLPLIVFEDENLIEYAGIWSEENPNWKQRINEILDKKI